jgi:hypothetical protein
LVDATPSSYRGRGGLADEPGQWFGEQDGFAPQLEADLGVAGVDVVKGEADDAAGGLGVEKYQESGDAVLGFDGVVVQQPAGLVPAGLGVDGPGGAVPSGRCEAGLNASGWWVSSSVAYAPKREMWARV